MIGYQKKKKERKRERERKEGRKEGTRDPRSCTDFFEKLGRVETRVIIREGKKRAKFGNIKRESQVAVHTYTHISGRSIKTETNGVGCWSEIKISSTRRWLSFCSRFVGKW